MVYQGECCNGIPEVLVKSLMSMYEGGKKKVTIDSVISAECGSTDDLCCCLLFSHLGYI